MKHYDRTKEENDYFNKSSNKKDRTTRLAANGFSVSIAGRDITGIRSCDLVEHLHPATV